MNTKSFNDILHSIENERRIPGLIEIDGEHVLYFKDDNKNSFDEQFYKLTNFSEPINAKFGGVVEGGCSIILPNGVKYHAISFHGDIDGWNKDLEIGSKGLNISLATIKNNKIFIDEGSSFSLDECEVQFY